MIKGQEELFTKIDSFTNETLPHSILLIGEVGSGKDEVCKYIADKFDLDLFDLTESISNEFIDQINQMQTRSLYVVDMQKITIKDQNSNMLYVINKDTTAKEDGKITITYSGTTKITITKIIVKRISTTPIGSFSSW